jgi:8-oxo-dGTP pyrophosphatase MutT (NUDIX family)
VALVEKVCVVVTRHHDGVPHLLVFRHPLAGIQLVKGGIEAPEDAGAAAVRELAEETGITDASVVADLGASRDVAPGEVWRFITVDAGPLPDEWVFHCADGGGHDFTFFWHRLDAEPTREWHPLFAAALDYIRGAGGSARQSQPH